MITDNIKSTYSNQTVHGCLYTGSRSDPDAQSNAYGFQRCLTYQLKDQAGVNYAKGTTVAESYDRVDATVPYSSYTRNGASNIDGEFADMLRLVNVGATLPSNACVVAKQTITVEGNVVRTNCLVCSSTDVTINDVSSAPTSCAIGNFHC